jgi:hypothetical protein
MAIDPLKLPDTFGVILKHVSGESRSLLNCRLVCSQWISSCESRLRQLWEQLVNGFTIGNVNFTEPEMKTIKGGHLDSMST